MAPIQRTMKKKAKEHEDGDDQTLEILKAVAQAWHSHSGSSEPANEFDAHLRKFKPEPSRFKLEAMKRSSGAKWDFRESLWDSYEIVTVSKRLESCLVLEDNYPFVNESSGSSSRFLRRKRESKNSLRNLFNNKSSRRYDEPKMSGEET